MTTNTVLEQLNARFYQTLQVLRVADAPIAVLEQANEQLKTLHALLEPYKKQGTYAQSMLDADTMPLNLQGGFTEMMPYSPFVGCLHPASPRFDFNGQDGLVETRVEFPASYAGPPASVHGGFVAAVFDELLSAANLSAGLGAFTASLKVDYRKTTPLLKPVDLRAKVQSVDGRKVITSGEFSYKGEITAVAEGLFIMPSADYHWDD